MGFNATTNFLTRMQCSLQLYAQAVIGAAWSVAGDMYTNRGPFALYRATAVRKYMPVYRDEFFLGRRITLGDDSLLALCASAEGRSVQQMSAFGLTMWPEKMGHHLRQRIRWARGRTVRNFWRVKYRPIFSYCWWFTIAGIYGFLFSVLPDRAHGRVLARERARRHTGAYHHGNSFCSDSMCMLCFPRSDESRADRVLLFLEARRFGPVVVVGPGPRSPVLGNAYVLPRQGWTTRQHGDALNPGRCARGWRAAGGC